MNLENWSSIYKYWISLNVPDMTFITFDKKKHSPNSPWFEKERQIQPSFLEDPILDTGAHLGRYLKDKPQELIDAYKIFAFLRFSQLDDLADLDDVYDIVDEPFKNYNENFLNWWNPAAKHVFPYYNNIHKHHFSKSVAERKETTVKDVIDMAAQAWTDIANKWALVIVPDYMDRGNKEFKRI